MELVNKRAFANTYKRGYERLEQYKKVMEALKSGKGPNEIERMGLADHRLASRWKRGVKPGVARGIEAIGEFLPLHLRHKNFEDFNKLAALVFSTGYLDRKFSIQLNIRKNESEFKKLLSKLGLKYKGKGNKKIIGEKSAAVGRILKILGVSHAKKKSEIGKLPSYIYKIKQMHKAAGTEEKEMYKKHLKDFVDVVLKHKNYGKYLELHSIADKGDAEKLGRDFGALLKIAYPKTKFSTRLIERKGKYRPRFWFLKKE